MLCLQLDYRSLNPALTVMLSLFSSFIFGSHHDGGSSSRLTNLLWKDKSLCFDVRQSDLKIDHGEQLIGSFFPIEDIKGNQDEMGLLEVTNLRLIWICCNKKRVNLSIGWRTVSLAFEQNLKDSLGRPVTSLCIISKHESTKYEFVFNKMKTHDGIWNSEDNWDISMQLRKYIRQDDDKTVVIKYLSPMYLDDPFEVVFKIWHLYKQTGLFRYCRANVTNMLPRDSCVQQGAKLDEYSKLAGEETIDIYSEVIQTESRSIKYSGSLILTNIRLIWIDAILSLRNLSIPYIRVESMKVKQNKILIKTLDYLATSNHIELGLEKTHKAAKIKLMLEQIQNLYSLYKTKPKFGPESCEESLIYMSHLRPAEHYLESSFDGSVMRNVENFGPEMNRTYPVEVSRSSELKRFSQAHDLADSGIEDTENELSKYSVKLNSYLDDQPIARDKEIMYSKELGLAVERPANNLDIDRIWRMDL